MRTAETSGSEQPMVPADTLGDIEETVKDAHQAATPPATPADAAQVAYQVVERIRPSKVAKDLDSIDAMVSSGELTAEDARAMKGDLIRRRNSGAIIGKRIITRRLTP
jgi:hypothetical protein